MGPRFEPWWDHPIFPPIEGWTKIRVLKSLTKFTQNVTLGETTVDHTIHWKPTGTPRAVVALVHGLGEHVNRYAHVGSFLNGAGIAVIGKDLHGHGRRPGRKGHSPGLDSLLDDIDQLVSLCHTRYEGIPVFLYGHSMGGTLVLYSTIFRPSEGIAGIICTSPWLKLPKPPSPALILAARMINAVFPWITQPNGLNAEDLSRDPSVVKAYQNDPLVHNRISARMAVQLTDAAARLLQLTNSIPLPTLLMHGVEDRITDPEGSRIFAKKDTEHIKLVLWNGCRHELHNEPEQTTVLQTMVNWMEPILSRGTSS